MFKTARLSFSACVAAALAFLVLAVIAAPARAEDKARTVTVTGTGSAAARPDTAHITTGVVSEGETARAALDANTEAMTKMVAALKARGVAAKDLQTTDFAVHPKYQQGKDGAPARIVGYRVANTVRITVRDIADLGEILDAAVSFGSNQIGGIAFSIAEADALTDAAREKAMADAKRKAALYAAAAGAKLGPVMTIAEDVERPTPRPAFARAALEAKAVPIEAGEQTLTVRVNVTWELE